MSIKSLLLVKAYCNNINNGLADTELGIHFMFLDACLTGEAPG